MSRSVATTLTAFLLAACSASTIKNPSSAHLRAENHPASESAQIPTHVSQNVAPLNAKPIGPIETYSVVVNNLPAQDLLFALARDAKLNIDVHPGIDGNVTLNAINQTLPQLLKRIAKQIDMRYELDGENLSVMPDAPFLRIYKVDYVNMLRDTSGTVSVTTQVTSGAGGTGPNTTGIGMLSGANNSITRVENKSQNHFWETITRNIREILHETDKILPEGSSETIFEQTKAQSTTGTGTQPAAPRSGSRRRPQASTSLATSPHPAAMLDTDSTVIRKSTFREAASVISHPESGVLSIRATSRQHEKIQEFIDHVMQNVKRQVLIEATVAEVRLSSDYQQGIDWSAVPIGGSGFSIIQRAQGLITGPPSSLLQLSYSAPASHAGVLKSAITLLESFGTVKVLSSPKLSVMNNQTAVMKVVDTSVYFTLRADTVTNTNSTTTTFTTTLQSVPVGFVMNVTPQIGDTDTVMLNIRPSISSIVDYVIDPNPTLANPCGFGTTSCNIPPISSKIPVVRTREMESVIRVGNGNIAVMGGLIEDRLEKQENSVPGLSQLPLIGELFKQRRDQTIKTELVIFLRPIILRDASLNGDFSGVKHLLPDRNFFTGSAPSSSLDPPKGVQ